MVWVFTVELLQASVTVHVLMNVLRVCSSPVNEPSLYATVGAAVQLSAASVTLPVMDGMVSMVALGLLQRK